MKRILRWFSDIFSPKELQGLDAAEIVDAMNDPAIRKTWLWEVFEELKRLNLEVDHRLMTQEIFEVRDLCGKRRAYQDILEAVLSAKRTVKSKNHNPQAPGEFDLDSVTVKTSPYK